ncbi:cytoskeleton-associated protein 5 isoform X2 [Octopus sinensis]|uniref:Cytoskeleton-associated protein 5 isoform X2 n=1 Tax=Octopus sinensis TaxID=2607531 RepID=A0A6P7SDG9_9MOLL|nr:cytoskeleton-associated protein 5 isoform X2 [Octopus sinensis]
MADDSEWMKLPTEGKCQHKVWKARVSGYEEATKLFNSLTDDKNPEFSKYQGLIKKFVVDSNVVAQEKGLEAVLAYVENAQVATRVCAEVIGGIVAKCFNVNKTKTKELANEIILMYIEIEKQDIVLEELLKGVEYKQPKIVVGSVMALTRALREYGSKVVQVKPIIKVLARLLEDRDKTVREETKQLVIEIYRWIGAAIKSQFTNFNPIQVQEFEAEFEKLPAERPIQTRFLRSQQDLKAKLEQAAAAAAAAPCGDGDAPGAAHVEEVDPYDLMEPVNILAMLPKNFYDQIEAKKWQERKEALDALLKLASNLKLEPGDYQPLIKCVIKVIGKDTNVMLVALGGKILAGIALGLRKEFKQYANMCFGVLLDKFKEKKLAVVAALREAIDAVFQCMNFELIMEDAVAALENKNPSIRTETASFLARSIAKAVPNALPKKILKVYCVALVKTINDPVPEVRESSFEALGTAMQLVGEKNIMPFITDVDNIKQQKIKECAEKAVLLLPNGQPRNSQKSQPSAVTTTTAAATSKAVTSSKPAAQQKKPGADRPRTAPASSKSRAADGKKGSKKGSAADRSSKDEPVEAILSDDVYEEKAESHLGAETLGQLASSNWKERLQGIEQFLNLVKGLAKEEIPTQVFVRVICKKPGLKDSNFQVLKLKIELIGVLAQKANFTKCSAGFCLESMVEKIGDVKTGNSCKEALSSIAEAISLDFVCQEVIHSAFAQKNPKNQAEALNWLSQAIKEFGLKVNFKSVNENVKKALAATNPAVRTAAIQLLGVVYMYMGPSLRMFYENEKPALLQQIDAEFEKAKSEKPPAPTRAVVKTTNEESEDTCEENENGSESVNVEDLIPRTDIGDKITSEILAEMGDKNWKIRNEGLQKVTVILNENKFVLPNLGQLPEALKARLGDSNKNMVITTLGILGTLATSLGPHCKQHIRTIGPGIISCFGDSKVHLRAAAVNALNAWVEHCNIHALVECEAFSDALKIENPNLRMELLGWLSEKLPNVKSLPNELKVCVPLLLNCLEDRNGDVRKKAQESIVPFMIHVGYECMFRAATKAKLASKDQLIQILEKARANLPEKPVKAVKSAPNVPKAAPVASVKVEAFDYDEEPDGPPVAARPQTTPEGKSKAGKSTGVGRGKAVASAKSSKKKEEEDLSPPLMIGVSKDQRTKDERLLKVLKWNFTEPRPEFVEQLRNQMEKNFSKPLMDQLFHSDFKSHIKAIETLTKCLDTQKLESISNLDLILKWLTLRFFDTNPSMLNKALEYIQNVFDLLAEEDYHLNDIEAVSFIPYLIQKVGDPKDNVRQNVRGILKSVCKVYPGSKLFPYIIDGLRSKNSKQRAECLEECSYLMEVYSMSVCQPNPAHALKLIAQQISDRDNGVRNAALNTLVTAYMMLNDKLFNLTGPLCDKDQSLLDERIKRQMKNRQVNGPKIVKEERPQKAAQTSQKIIQPVGGSIRPNTAGGIPKHHTESVSRAAYTLDIEEDVNQLVEMPKLIQLDLDEIYQPVTLPKTRKFPTVKGLLGNSGDMSAHVNFVISQITNKDIDLSIQALCQLDEVLRDPEKSTIFASCIDQLLLAISMQIKMSCSAHMSSEDVSKDDLTRLYRSLLATMMTVFSNKSLGTQASRDVLKDLTNSVITLLLDSRLMDLGEGPQVVRAVNTTVIRIMENSNFTNMLSASIRLLHDSVSSETCTPKFIEMIMKCMWRMVRMLPDSMNDLNTDKILHDIHLFFKAFPANSWKDRSSDLPYRTVKTILHTLTKLKGNKILSHLTLVDDENSELEGYLSKILKSGVGQSHDGHREEIKHKRLSKNSHDMLAEIFKKIGSKENTVQGLNELYDFKEKNPDADLSPYLKKSSEFFQSYIDNGMKTIAHERRRGMKKASHTHPSNNPNTHNQSPDDEIDPSVYRERLRRIRMMCGLDDSEEGEKSDSPKLSDASNTINQALEEETKQMPQINAHVPQSDSRPMSVVADVSELKMRLDRIKKNQV